MVAFKIGEHGLECGQGTVNVGQKKYFHNVGMYLYIICVCGECRLNGRRGRYRLLLTRTKIRFFVELKKALPTD